MARKYLGEGRNGKENETKSSGLRRTVKGGFLYVRWVSVPPRRQLFLLATMSTEASMGQVMALCEFKSYAPRATEIDSSL